MQPGQCKILPTAWEMFKSCSLSEIHSASTKHPVPYIREQKPQTLVLLELPAYTGLFRELGKSVNYR